jgi:hypothetical protein
VKIDDGDCWDGDNKDTRHYNTSGNCNNEVMEDGGEEGGYEKIDCGDDDVMTKIAKIVIIHSAL